MSGDTEWGHTGGDTLCSPNHPLFAAANPPHTLLTEFSPARGTRKEGKERSRNKSPSQKNVQLVTFCSRCPVGFGASGSIPCASARLQLQMLEMLRIIHNPAHEVHACPGPEAARVPRLSTGDTWLLPSPTATWGTLAFYGLKVCAAAPARGPLVTSPHGRSFPRARCCCSRTEFSTRRLPEVWRGAETTADFREAFKSM